MLPPTLAAVRDYFQRHTSRIAELSPETVLANERLWSEACGDTESVDPALILPRDAAATLDDPFQDRQKFGPVGVYAVCTKCKRTFESRGLRLCNICAPASSHGQRVPACEGCGTAFPPGTRSDAKFCGDECRKRVRRVTDRGRDNVRDNADLTSQVPTPDYRGHGPRETAASETDLSVTVTPLKCESCRRDFQPARKDARFCSTACKQRAYRSRPRFP